MGRYLIVVLADEHAGSKFGLRNPDTTFERITWEFVDGSFQYTMEDHTPVIDPVQELIWQRYISARDEILEIAGKDDIYILKLAEVCEGTYYKNSSMDLKKHNQVKLAVHNMDPWRVDNVKAVRILQGDRAHEFDEGAASNLVAMQLQGRKPFFDTKSVTHGMFVRDNFSVDYAHRGPYPGSRKWLEGNIARYYLRDYMMRELIEFDRNPVDLVLRAHYHQPVEEKVTIRQNKGMLRSHLLVAPCLKFPDGYARMATKNKFSHTVGVAAIEVLDGELYKYHHFWTTVDVRTREIFNVEQR